MIILDAPCQVCPSVNHCPKVIRLLDNIVRWLEFSHKVEFAISDKDAGLLDKIPVQRLMQTLQDDGVDLEAFYSCACESVMSEGGWMPLESTPRHRNPWKNDANDDDNDNNGDRSMAMFAIPPMTNHEIP